MIDYALAKEMQDAGFPFRRIRPGDKIPNTASLGEDVNGNLYPYFDFNPDGDEALGAQHFYIPTLEELIEACGGMFKSLENMTGGRWDATSVGVLGPHGFRGTGTTPKVAVARLLLALNKKP